MDLLGCAIVINHDRKEDPGLREFGCWKPETYLCTQIIEDLNKAGYDVTAMERFGAQPTVPLDVCLSELRKWAVAAPTFLKNVWSSPMAVFPVTEPLNSGRPASSNASTNDQVFDIDDW